MTREDFQSQLDEMSRKGRKFRIIAVPWSVLMMIFVGWRMPHTAKHLRDGQLAALDLLALAASVVSIVILIIYLRQFLKRNAPKCPACRKIITFPEREFILKTHLCPFCKSRIIDEP
jgi:hypothetical protein